MSFSVMHNMCSQILFRIDGGVYAGILMPNGDAVINAGNGEIHKRNEVEVISVYTDWVDLTDDIVGIDDWR